MGIYVKIKNPRITNKLHKLNKLAEKLDIVKIKKGVYNWGKYGICFKEDKLMNRCSCGSETFLIISEKIYEGMIQDEILKCDPDNEGIIEIKCKQCKKPYNAKVFKEIEW